MNRRRLVLVVVASAIVVSTGVTSAVLLGRTKPVALAQRAVLARVCCLDANGDHDADCWIDAWRQSYAFECPSGEDAYTCSLAGEWRSAGADGKPDGRVSLTMLNDGFVWRPREAAEVWRLSRQLGCDATRRAWACAVSPPSLAGRCEWVTVDADRPAHPQVDRVRVQRADGETLFERVLNPPDFDVVVPLWRPNRPLPPIASPGRGP